MPFKYSCFISYPGSRHSLLLGRFVTELSESLSNEIELYLKEPVFLDKERPQAGEPWEDERGVAAAICQSVCMVTILVPVYFRSKHCLREYVAMKTLEEQRLKLLPDPGNYSLIIPIVLRGANFLPPEIRNQRHYFDFSNFTTADMELYKNPAYHVYIQRLADYVHKLYRALTALPKDVSADCAQFELPREDEMDKWLDYFDPADAALAFPSLGARMS